MKVTNIHNIDQSIYNVVSRVYPPRPNRYSVTDLCNPPLIRVLREKYWDKLEEDAADKIWMVLGSSVHYVIEKGAPSLTIPEGKIERDWGANTIVGKADLWAEGTIKDYKVSSVYAFLLGDKAEWEIQLNLCAWLFRYKGFPVDQLKISAILRDWQSTKAKYDKEYPQIAFIEKDIPIWKDDECSQYVDAWLDKYKITKEAMEQLEPHQRVDVICHPDSRWEKPTTYAVKQKGRKSALRVLDTLPEAETWLQKRIEAKNDDVYTKKLYIETREGESTRCKRFCPVRKVCPVNPHKGEIE